MFQILLKLLWFRGITPWLLLLAFLAGGWAWYKRDIIKDYFEKSEQRNQYRAEVNRLKKEVTRKEEERKILSDGGFENEKIARDILHMSKPGEKVLFIEGAKTASDTPSTFTLKSRDKRLNAGDALTSRTRAKRIAASDATTTNSTPSAVPPSTKPARKTATP